MNLPSAWEFVVAALAVWRLFHLIAEDTILDGPRGRLLRLSAGWRDAMDEPGYVPPPEYRAKWAAFITCPYCLGAHLALLAVVLYCVFVDWIGVLSLLAVWFALSAAVALIATIHSAITEE